MYRTTYQKGLFTIFFSGGLDPLKNWNVKHRDGFIKRVYDLETGVLVMELGALNVSLTRISTPLHPKQTLGINLPILNLLLRNTNKFFSFEVGILDDTRMRRRFRCGNFIRKAAINFSETTIPLFMGGNDWVLIYFNIAEFTRRCYNCNYLEAERVQINGSVQLRRIFFSDKVVEYCNLPKDYQIILIDKKQPQRKRPPIARPPSPLSAKVRSAQTKSIAKGSSVSSITVTVQQSATIIPGSPTGDEDADGVDKAALTKVPSRDVMVQEAVPATAEPQQPTAETQEPAAQVEEPAVKVEDFAPPAEEPNKEEKKDDENPF